MIQLSSNFRSEKKLLKQINSISNQLFTDETGPTYYPLHAKNSVAEENEDIGIDFISAVSEKEDRNDIYQELKEIIPSAVSISYDSPYKEEIPDFHTVAYNELFGYLVQTIQVLPEEELHAFWLHIFLH